MTIDSLNPSSAYLKEITRQILEHRKSFFKLNHDQLTWETLNRDTENFYQVVSFLWSTAAMTDDKFATAIPQIETLLSQSEIFQRLKSPDIKVTAGHKDTTPYQHTLAVLNKMVTTDEAKPVERFILRMAAIFHDSGKGLVADLIHEHEVAELFGLDKEDGQPTRHTHPDHAVISALILKALVTEVASTYGNQSETEKLLPLLDQVILIILHHHLFHDLALGNATDEEVVTVFRSRPELIWMIFLLCRADVDSTPSYRTNWSHNYELMQQLSLELEVLTADLSVAFSQAILGLPVELINSALETK